MAGRFARAVMFAIIGAAACFGVARAAPLSDACTIHLRSSSALPTEIADLFRDAEAHATPEALRYIQHVAVAYCAFDLVKPPSYAYWLLTPPVSDMGVCHYTQQDVTPAFSADRKYLGKRFAVDRRPPQYMALANGPCPPLNDDAYIDADGVPPGVFASLMQFWQSVMTSPAALDAASSDLTPEERSAPAYRQFLTLAQVSKKKPIAPWTIELNGNDNDFRRRHGEALAFTICADDVRLDVDLGPQGWRIVHVASFVP